MALRARGLLVAVRRPLVGLALGSLVLHGPVGLVVLPLVVVSYGLLADMALRR